MDTTLGVHTRDFFAKLVSPRELKMRRLMQVQLRHARSLAR